MNRRCVLDLVVSKPRGSIGRFAANPPIEARSIVLARLGVVAVAAMGHPHRRQRRALPVPAAIADFAPCAGGVPQPRSRRSSGCGAIARSPGG